MQNKRQFISIVGATCAGKSTLQQVLKSVLPEKVMIIPQMTIRNSRASDNPSGFVYTRKITVKDMFLYNKELSYGISQESMSQFINSKFEIGVAINGTDEIELLANSTQFSNEIEVFNILLTFSNNVNKEIIALHQNLPIYFDKQDVKKRESFFKGHIKNKLLNKKFINTHINLHLTREMSLAEWADQLTNLTNIDLDIKDQLRAAIIENSQKRKITKHRYYDPFYMDVIRDSKDNTKSI